MELILDIGNTRVKYAAGNHLGAFDNLSQTSIEEIFSAFSGIKSCIVSTVKVIDDPLLKNLSDRVETFILFNEETPIPITNLYENPKTLGKDRLAGVIGANNIFPNDAVLVVDMGTAITFDFIDAEKKYYGGTISPGLITRFKALNKFTSLLPLCNPADKEFLIANNTEDAIVSGVQNGIIFEINGYIEALSILHPELKVIITGGDALNFVKKLKKPIFAEPNLIFIGLKTILNYNAKK